MKILKELTSIIARQKLAPIEVIDSRLLTAKKNKISELYHGLAEGRFENDQEAALHLYGSTAVDDKYRQLKSRFRRRLLNTIFFLDHPLPSAPDPGQALLHCERSWALAQILRHYGSATAARQLSRNVLRTALQYHFTHLIIESARMLRLHALKENDLKAFQQYQQHLEEYLPKQRAEIQAEELFLTLTWRRRDRTGDAAQFNRKITDSCDQLLHLSEKYDTPSINFYMFLAWILRYELQGDYNAMLEVGEQAEKFLTGNPYFSTPEKMARIQLRKLSAYLHARDFQGGKSVIENSTRILPQDGPYWLDLLEFYLLLALHTRHFLPAFAIFQQAAVHPQFKKLTISEKEKWQVFEGYLHYFATVKQLEPLLPEKRRSAGFQLKEFLNTQFAHSPKRINLTVQLTTLQILFLLEHRNLRLASQKIKQLQKYALPTLKKHSHDRPLLFVQLLQQLIRIDFQMDNLHDYSAHLQKLQAAPLAYTGRSDELEVIPYERLWQQIITYLS